MLITENENTESKDVEAIEPELVETDLDGNEIVKTRSLESIVRDFESADDLLSNPDFDPKVLVGEIKNKIDGIDFFIKWCNDRAKQYKETSASYYNTQKSIQSSIDRLKKYCVDIMVLNEATTYAGNLRRMDLQCRKTFTITAEPSAAMHMKYPKLCKSKTVYEWDRDAVKAELKADKLAEGIAEDKDGNPYIQFRNNSNLKKAKGVKKKRKTTKKVIEK